MVKDAPEEEIIPPTPKKIKKSLVKPSVLKRTPSHTITKAMLAAQGFISLIFHVVKFIVKNENKMKILKNISIIFGQLILYIVMNRI